MRNRDRGGRFVRDDLAERLDVDLRRGAALRFLAPDIQRGIGHHLQSTLAPRDVIHHRHSLKGKLMSINPRRQQGYLVLLAALAVFVMAVAFGIVLVLGFVRSLPLVHLP
jgi:hypothetical protein